jgi:hypothetical protein
VLIGVDGLSDQEIEGILKSPTRIMQHDSGLVAMELFRRLRPASGEEGKETQKKP